MNELDFKLWLEKRGGWFLVWLFAALPVVFWTFTTSLTETFSNSVSGLFAIGRIAGLIGLVLYAINLVLAARTRWMEPLFGGLNRVYIAHHMIGGIALILLCMHPLFMALRYVHLDRLISVKDAAMYLVPRSFDLSESVTIFLQSFAINSGFVAFLGMVVLLMLTFYVKLPYRVWLATHRFLGVAFMFAGLHVVFISSDTSRNPVLKYYLLFWVTLGLAAFFYRSLLSNVLVRRYAYRVNAIEKLPGKIVGVSLEPIDGKMDYKPGQFIFIRFLWDKRHGLTKEAHPFSIASSPQEDNVRIYAKSLGDYTSNLGNLEPGSIAEIEGAYGKFTFTRFGASPQVWIAGGIGITPFLGMARSYAESSPPVHLIYSVVNRSELLDQQAVAEYLPKTYQNFKYTPYVYDETKEFLNAEKVSELVGGFDGKEIFICGPPPMMKALKEQLAGMGVNKRRIHSEEFTMS